jgi:hypothetical protein
MKSGKLDFKPGECPDLEQKSHLRNCGRSSRLIDAESSAFSY